MFQGLIVNYIKFYLVQNLVFLIQFFIACKWPNQSRLIECNVMEFVCIFKNIKCVYVGCLYNIHNICWVVAVVLSNNCWRKYVVIQFDSCTIKMWFYPRTAQIFVTFSRVPTYVYNKILFFYFGHEIELPIALLDIWTHIRKKFFVNWRQFYKLFNTLRKYVYFSVFRHVASRVDTAKWRESCWAFQVLHKRQFRE